MVSEAAQKIKRTRLNHTHHQVSSRIPSYQNHRESYNIYIYTQSRSIKPKKLTDFGRLPTKRPPDTRKSWISAAWKHRIQASKLPFIRKSFYASLLVVQAKCDNWRKHVSAVGNIVVQNIKLDIQAWHSIGVALIWRMLGDWWRLAADWHLASRNCWHQVWFHTSIGTVSTVGTVHRSPGCPGQRRLARSVDEGPDGTTENSYDGIHRHTHTPTAEKIWKKTWHHSLQFPD